MGRPTKGAARLKKYKKNETQEQYLHRLSQDSTRNKQSRANESIEARKQRLAAIKQYDRLRFRHEFAEHYQYRLSVTQNRLASESSQQREHRLSLIHDRLARESNEERAHRLDHIRQRLSNETFDERAHRLGLIHQRISNETVEERAHRLGLIRQRLSNETVDERAYRLDLIRQRISNETVEERAHRLGLVRQRISNETEEERAHRLGLIRQRISNETEEERAHRLSLIRQRILNETLDERAHRLDLIHQRISNETVDEHAQRLSLIHQRFANETPEQRANRLSKAKRRSQIRRLTNNCNFTDIINQYADIPCSVCKRLLYPKQRKSLNIVPYSNFLPQELVAIEKITVCSRCETNLKKRKIPSQAYWNKMAVLPIPSELAALSEVESRLLSRIIPFMKIMKVQNRYSQQFCKGQVVLFAQDVVELAEQLPLPVTQAGLLFVVETRENVSKSKEFHIDVKKVKIALDWLLKYNHLYKVVRTNFANIANVDITQIIEVANDVNDQNVDNTDAQDYANNRERTVNSYVMLPNNVHILRGTFHQGSNQLQSAGVQCTAIAAVACVALSVTDPNTWAAYNLDYILIKGDSFYRQCVHNRLVPDSNEMNTEFLAVTELQSEINFLGSRVHINVNYNSSINGHLLRDASAEGFPNLENGIEAFFSNIVVSKFGILTANSISVCIAYKEDMYWLIDSHARGPKGHKARTRGLSCCMRFENMQQLTQILLSNLKSSHGIENTLNIYSLTPISLVENNIHSTDIQSTNRSNILSLQPSNNHITENNIIHTTDSLSNSSQALVSNHPEISGEQTLSVSRNEMPQMKNKLSLICSTSMLHFIDENIPNLDYVIGGANVDIMNLNVMRVADIHRKTAPPLNIERERRMEELSWYTLYPDGRNGFGEPRDIPITPLDYFQARVMGNEPRFQRVDYLFYALSVVEYFRTKASISVSCRMRQGEQNIVPQGLVDNLHLTMRNIRGSASYWKRCSAELIAMVRSLGAPTWFVTFSCNDLNWSDMMNALVIADGRPDTNVDTLTFQERLELVEKYPVIISRQFTLRVLHKKQ